MELSCANSICGDQKQLSLKRRVIMMFCRAWRGSYPFGLLHELLSLWDRAQVLLLSWHLCGSTALDIHSTGLIIGDDAPLAVMHEGALQLTNQATREEGAKAHCGE